MLNCFRYLKCKSLEEAESITFFEYSLRITAYKLNDIDEQRLCYLIAFANRAAKITKRNGKEYKYKDISDIFDYEQKEKDILEEQFGQGSFDKKVSQEQLSAIKRVAEINRKGGV